VATFYGVDFGGRVGRDEILSEIFSRYERELAVFSLIMHSRMYETERLGRFRTLSGRIMSISLSRDTVIPPLSVLRSVNGDGVPRPGFNLEMRFPFYYSREIPFPVDGGDGDDPDSAFEQTFATASGFFSWRIEGRFFV
jgi:hypothetical protein